MKITELNWIEKITLLRALQSYNDNNYDQASKEKQGSAKWKLHMDRVAAGGDLYKEVAETKATGVKNGPSDP